MESSYTQAGGPRKMPAFAFIPPAILLMACFGAAAQRHITLSLPSAAQFGKLSEAEARTLADKVCSEVTGGPSQSIDTSRQISHSVRRNCTLREWDVLCNTPSTLFLVRINANTGRVYAINRMGGGGEDPALALARLGGDKRFPSLEETRNENDSASRSETVLNRPEAEAQAKHFLEVIGVPAKALRPVLQTKTIAVGDADQWNFTFRRSVPGQGDRLVKVSLDGRSGHLTHIWNPVSSL